LLARELHERQIAVSYSAFPWSGDNSVRARAEAAKEFSLYLGRQLKSASDIDHFVVAHSHGGNVVLRALLDGPPDQCKALSGFVTMSTPFIWFEPLRAAPITKALAFLSNAVIPLVLFLATVVASYFLISLPFQDYFVQAPIMSGAVTIVGVLTGFAAGAYQIEKRSRIKELVNRATSAPQSEPEFPRLLVLRSPGDEASFGLRAAQIARAMIVFVWRLFDALFLFRRGPIKNLAHLLALIVATSALGMCTTMTPNGDLAFRPNAAWPTDVSMWTTSLYVGAFAIYYAGILTGTGISVAASIPMALAFGPELFQLSLSVTPVVEDSPPYITATVKNVPAGGLRHATHANRDVVHAIAEWLSDMAAAAQFPTAQEPK
jgi:hypothetical protein